MFVVSLKPKPAWHLSYMLEMMKFDEKEKANILQKQFVSAFNKETNAEVPVLDKKTEVNLPITNITREMVRYEILKLNINKQCEPDEMHPKF